ncbi:MAG: type VI secretion system contractile sheath large subunit [Acidobacteriota bacterium]|nr:type VI secretion system contractile sheath large subunit [Acidobacteriota bacterium]
MAKPYDFGEINLGVRADEARSKMSSSEETPFRILIMGDFSGEMGRASGGSAKPLRDRRPILIDRDNFDDVLRKSRAGIRIPLGEGESSLWFSDIDDFHPDRVYERAPFFQKLRDLRKRLSDPASFPEAAAELGIAASAKANDQETVKPPDPPDVAAMAGRNLLDDAIVSTESRGSGSEPASGGLAEFLNRAVAPHLVARPDPKQSEVIDLIDSAMSGQMCALLHIPAFQALEAAWRAVFFLTRRIETGVQLELCLLDVSKQELAEDLAPGRDLKDTCIYKLVVEQTVRTPGAEPWAVMAGNYTFERASSDLVLLSRLARIAAEAGAPFITGASPRFLGCEAISDLPDPKAWKSPEDSQDEKVWKALRAAPESAWLGLALPRFLLRLPYGKDTSEIASFKFEEMTEKSSHEDYLWGNPAFLCVLLLAEAFTSEGWEMQPGAFLETGGLPLHVYKGEDGEPEATPCAEVLMTEDAAERILQNGLMPFVSLKNCDAIRLLRFQSVGEPLRKLSARWTY